jgi:hypothetical protein
MQKLYCYVDETGQDTKGVLFLVALVIIDSELQDLRTLLQQIETDSDKGQKKWKKTIAKEKQAYLEAVLTLPPLVKGNLFYAEYPGSTDYLDHIIDAIAKAISQKTQQDYRATIFIDGLPRHQRKIVGSKLRRRGIRVEKVRGLRDEADEFIRLADAIAGFVRDAIEGQEPWKGLYQQALKKGVIRRL